MNIFFYVRNKYNIVCFIIIMEDSGTVTINKEVLISTTNITV